MVLTAATESPSYDLEGPTKVKGVDIGLLHTVTKSDDTPLACDICATHWYKTLIYKRKT
jgi:hypothetical protein